MFLIVFNLMSRRVRGALVTLAFSRFGDAALFVLLARFYLSFGIWDYFF